MTDTTTATEDRQVRPFAAWLRELRRGRTHRELSDALPEVVQAVQETGKAGTLTLLIKVTKSKYGAVIVEDKVTVKLPEGERDESLFFVDDGGNLVLEDPRQQRIPGIRDASKPDQHDDAEEATTA